MPSHSGHSDAEMDRKLVRSELKRFGVKKSSGSMTKPARAKLSRKMSGKSSMKGC